MVYHEPRPRPGPLNGVNRGLIRKGFKRVKGVILSKVDGLLCRFKGVFLRSSQEKPGKKRKRQENHQVFIYFSWFSFGFYLVFLGFRRFC